MRQFVDMFQRAGVVLSSFGLNFLALINFSTDDAAPLTDPYVGEIGSLDTLADTGNNLSTSGGALQIAGVAANNDPRAYILKSDGSADFDRIGGRTFIARHNRGSNNTVWYMGWNNNTSSRPLRAAFAAGSSNNLILVIENLAISSGPIAMNASTDYFIAIVLKSSGAEYYYKISGGNWRLIFKSHGITTTPQCAGAGGETGGAGVVTNDSYRVVDLPAPFNTDYGIALVNVTSFTQSLGSELLTNGDFSSWSGDNPVGWTVSGEVLLDPAVTQSGNAARFISTVINNVPFISQASILTIGAMYEMTAVISARTNGALSCQLGINTNINANSVQTFTAIARATGNTTVVVGAITAPTDITIDSISVKQITLNSQQNAVADGIFDFEFTLPGSPVAGQRCELRYRVVDTLNYWVMYIRRNSSNSAWDFLLDSVVAGVETNQASASGIGTPKRMQVRAIGNLHNCYTFDTSEVPTKRGGEVNNTTHNTATGLNTVYSSSVAPVRLAAYAVEHVMYNLLDRAMTPNAV